MKKKVRLIFAIILSCCFFAFVYWVTYRYTYEDLQNNKLYDEEQLLPVETTDAYTPVLQQMKEEKDESGIITAKTTYILEKYDELSGELTKEIIPVPIELLGLDYNGIYQYTLRKSTEDDENSRTELVAFQSDLLVLRRTFESKIQDYMFRLVAENGKVVVYEYYEDVIYTKTNIKIIDLPYELQQVIKVGLPIEDEKALFMFLESYSS